MKFLPAGLFHDAFIGLSLTQTAIRAMTVNSKGQVTQSNQVDLPAGTFANGQINQEQLAASLQQLLDQGNYKSEYVSVAIPEYYSFSRSYGLPNMPMSEVSNALAWQLDQVLPLPSESIYFDWKLISSQDSEMTVAIIAIPRDLLDQLIQVFEQVNLKPLTFEPSVSALSRLVTESSTQDTILIELSPDGSSVSLVTDQIAQITLTNQFQAQTSEQVSQALQQTADSVTTLQRHRQEHGQPIIKKCVLTGESATHEVSQWLAKVLNQPVKLLELYEVQPQFHQPYAVASISFSKLGESKVINLLPDSVRDYYAASRHRQKVVNYFKVIGAVLLTSLVLSAFGLLLAINRVGRSNQELTAFETSNSDFSYDSQEVVAINQSSRLIEARFENKATPVAQLETLFALQPESLQFSQFDFESNSQRLSVRGRAETRSQLLAFVDELKQVADFSQVELPISALERPQDIDFVIEITIQPQPDS